MPFEPQTRQEFQFSLATSDQGKIKMKMVDRITVDDVFLHLVHGEIYGLVLGEDPPEEVSEYFKDFLLKERFTSR